MATINNIAFGRNMFSFETYETDGGDVRVRAFIGDPQAERLTVYNGMHRTEEALNALHEFIMGDRYSEDGQEVGLHLKVNRKDTPANMSSAGYIGPHYKGTFMPAPVELHWHNITMESWQPRLGRPQPILEAELGEEAWITRARCVSRKMNAMDELVQGHTIRLNGMIYENDEPSVEKTLHYYEVRAKLMEMPTAEAREYINNNIANKVAFKNTAIISSNPEKAAETAATIATLPMKGGGEIAKNDLIGHVVRGYRGEMAMGPMWANVNEDNLDRIVASLKRNQLAVCLVDMI